MSNRAHLYTLACMVAAASCLASAADWPQFGYDAAHSGHNPVETSITASTVSLLRQSWVTYNYPYSVDAAPAYASRIATPIGTKDLLFAWGTNTMWDGSASSGVLMAFDAHTGDIVWSKQTTGASTQHASVSPAIDPDRQYVYSYGLDGYVHKYQIGDGTEMTRQGPLQFGWPVQVTLKPLEEKVAGSLTIAASHGATFLEVVTNGYNGDGGDYQGHLVSIDLSSGASNVFNGMCSDIQRLLASNTCPDRMGGIWGRAGATYAAAVDRLYVTTGNGVFNANSGGHSWGDSVLALAVDGASSSGIPSDSYTPSNFADLDRGDIDLGSMSIAILPAPAASAFAHLGVQGGKEGKFRLLNLDDMSGAGAPANVGGELQALYVPNTFAQPAVWVDPDDGSTWLLTGDIATGIHLEFNGNVPALVSRWTSSSSVTSPVVAGRIVYYLARLQSGAASVMARDVTSGSLLWQSEPLLDGLHWQSPIVVDGALYVFDSGRLYKFAPDMVFADGFELGVQ